MSKLGCFVLDTYLVVLIALYHLDKDARTVEQSVLTAKIHKAIRALHDDRKLDSINSC